MRTSTFRRMSRTAANNTITATNSAATESALPYPARTSRRPASTATEPPRSLAKCSALDAIAEQVERAIVESVPEVSTVQTHLEPLTETAGAAEVSGDVASVRDVVREVAGVEPHDLRFLETDDGLVAHFTLRLGAGHALADAHARASEIEERIRLRLPEIADVVVHTEPGE